MSKLKAVPDYTKFGLTQPSVEQASAAFLESLYACVGFAHPQGLSLEHHKLLFGAINKFETAHKSGAEDVELTPEEYSFLRQSVQNAKVPVANNKAILAIYDTLGV